MPGFAVIYRSTLTAFGKKQSEVHMVSPDYHKRQASIFCWLS